MSGLPQGRPSLALPFYTQITKGQRNDNTIHHDHVEKQFSSQASEYLTSTYMHPDEIYSVWLIILMQVY